MGKNYQSNGNLRGNGNFRGRLSLDTKLATGSYDARFKLNKRGGGHVKSRSVTRDARELLNSRKKRQAVAPSIRGRSATDPLMIVTGLDNVRRGPDHRMRVVSRPPPPDKTVVSDGRNTIVTLRNTNAISMDKMKFYEDSDASVQVKDSRREESSSGSVARRSGRIDNHDEEFKAIKVKISITPLLHALQYFNPL